jgi:hypothetical protein
MQRKSGESGIRFTFIANFEIPGRLAAVRGQLVFKTNAAWIFF